MKKYYLFLALGLTLLGGANAQTTITDSIETGPSYGNEVYYSLKNGKVSEVATTNWHLAFSIGNANVAVRANTAGNYTADQRVAVYEMVEADTSEWAAFDTTGYETDTSKWVMVDNSDEDWQEGAFNQNAAGHPDYGWGKYNSTTHVILGQRLYMAKYMSGANTVYKKIWILNKTLGTWNIRIANIDGTDLKDIQVASSEFPTKNFVYVSLETGAVVDREPVKTDWDFVYTYYAAWQAGAGMYYPAAGILTNQGVKSSKVVGQRDSTTLADTTTFSSNISTIGYNWKSTMGVVDTTLSYFIKALDGAYWKLTFISFKSGANATTGTGRVVFDKTKLTPSTGVAAIGEEVKNVTVYPNPASSQLTVLFEAQSANSTIIMTDITGKQVYNQQVESSSFTQHTMDVSNFTKGIYFLNVINGNSRSVQKVVVN